jgi:hypothetical protein
MGWFGWANDVRRAVGKIIVESAWPKIAALLMGAAALIVGWWDALTAAQLLVLTFLSIGVGVWTAVGLLEIEAQRYERRMRGSATLPLGMRGAHATRFFVNHHGANWEDDGRRDHRGRPLLKGPLCIHDRQPLLYAKGADRRAPRNDDVFGPSGNATLACSACNMPFPLWQTEPSPPLEVSRREAGDLLIEVMSTRLRGTQRRPDEDPRELVTFGTAVDLNDDGMATEWAIPVSALFGRFESCMAHLLVDGQKRPGLWFHPCNSPSQLSTLNTERNPRFFWVALRPDRCNLDRERPRKVPMGVTRLLDHYCTDDDRRLDLEPGTHEIRLRVVFSEFEWQSPRYVLHVPPEDEVVNRNFTLDRLD